MEKYGDNERMPSLWLKSFQRMSLRKKAIRRISSSESKL